MILPEEMEFVPFLRGLDAPHRNRLALMARLKDCEAGTTLFRDGEESAHFYFVLSGTVNLEIEEPVGESVEITTAGPGEMLGWSSVLGSRGMTATARTATRCRLADFDGCQIQALCEQDPVFGAAFLRQIALVLTDRLSSTRRHLAKARSLGPRMPVASIGESQPG